ncbi:MAG: hypothetical protein UX59_C0024G0001, partial [Microgenomates group bacterium GW2011_GWA1_46_7]
LSGLKFKILEPAFAIHFGNNGVDGDVEPRVVDTFVGGSFIWVHQEVFEAFDFFTGAEGDAEFFDGEDVAFAVVLVLFDKGGEHFFADRHKGLIKIFGFGHRVIIRQISEKG